MTKTPTDNDNIIIRERTPAPTTQSEPNANSNTSNLQIGLYIALLLLFLGTFLLALYFSIQLNAVQADIADVPTLHVQATALTGRNQTLEANVINLNDVIATLQAP